MVGLRYLHYAYRLSNEAVVARWVHSLYYRPFTGETFFQHRPPIDPSSLSRRRGRIGEEGGEWLLAPTIHTGQMSDVIEEDSVERVGVDLEEDQKMGVGPCFPAEA